MLCKQPFSNYGCGQCLPCRINLRRVWTSRIMLEAEGYENTSFLTLTYDDDFVPRDASGRFVLDPLHLKNFWKKIRNYFPPRSIRYYACGEYGHEGERQWNPHYHAALYGVSCEGSILRADTGRRCYCNTCALVRKVWEYGNVTLDELNDTTAAYICGYVIKKMTVDDDFRLDGRPPEFSRQSQGIGKYAAFEIAAHLKASGFLDNALQFGDVPFHYVRGNTSVPLGRYMRRKMREFLDRSIVDPNTGEIKFVQPPEVAQAISQSSISPRMQSVLDALKDVSKPRPETLWQEYDSLKKKEKQRRLQKVKNVETKHEIYKQRKEL